MGRGIKAPPAYASIGDRYVDDACKLLDRAAQADAAMMIPQRKLNSAVVDYLFNPDHLAKLRAAAGLCDPSSKYAYYALAPHAPGVLTLHFKDQHVLTPQPCCYQPNADADPLFDDIRALERIQTKWGAVKHLLRWFNRNATPGSIRAYWPSVMKLCPTSPTVRDMINASLPSRYTEPAGISERLPLIRETAGTVAQLALMGDRNPNPQQGWWLTLPAAIVTVEGVPINVDQIAFNL